MLQGSFCRSGFLLALGAVQLTSLTARAAVPTAYKGTPYKGTPQAIPGRVELADMDLGGQGVAWAADHNRMNSAGYEPISGNDYRPDDKNLPNICKTNKQNPDFMVGTGAPYPATTPTKEVYYMGYAHAHDWVRMTVDVKQAGTYNVSSTWASANGQWGLSLWFNDGSNPTAPMDGVNKSGKVVMPGTSDYHKWKDYPNFTQVQLGAGVQLLTFHLEQEDHLQYGFLQFDLVGGDGGVVTPTDAGAAGAGGGAADATGNRGHGLDGRRRRRSRDGRRGQRSDDRCGRRGWYAERRRRHGRERPPALEARAERRRSSGHGRGGQRSGAAAGRQGRRLHDRLWRRRATARRDARPARLRAARATTLARPSLGLRAQDVQPAGEIRGPGARE